MTVMGIRAAAAVLAMLWCQQATAQDAAAVGTVVQQLGTVTALRGAGPGLLLIGAPVFRSDRIVTAAASRVRIEFVDRSVLAIGPESDVVVADYLVDGDDNRLRGVISLLLGIVRATVGPGRPDAAFDIESRAAVASVRATDWVVEVQSDRTSVFVVEGTVTVAAASGAGSVVLTAGQGTDVLIDRDPAEPKLWGAARVRDVLDRTRVP